MSTSDLLEYVIVDKKFNISLRNIIGVMVVVTSSLSFYFNLVSKIEILSNDLQTEIKTRERSEIWLKDSISRIETKLDKALK